MDQPKKYRSKILEDFREEMKDYIPPKHVSPSKDYMIGLYIGEVIWLTTMPTLSHEPCQSNTVIKVGEEDGGKVLTASNKWYLERKDLTKEDESWKEYQRVRKEIINKYLPKEYTFYTHEYVEINDEVLKGIRFSLWNSDGCYYEIEPNNIKVEKDENFTKLIFKLPTTNE